MNWTAAKGRDCIYGRLPWATATFFLGGICFFMHATSASIFDQSCWIKTFDSIPAAVTGRFGRDFKSIIIHSSTRQSKYEYRILELVPIRQPLQTSNSSLYSFPNQVKVSTLFPHCDWGMNLWIRCGQTGVRVFMIADGLCLCSFVLSLGRNSLLFRWDSLRLLTFHSSVWVFCFVLAFFFLFSDGDGDGDGHYHHQVTVLRSSRSQLITSSP